MVDFRNVFFLNDNSSESLSAQSYLKSRQISFTELDSSDLFTKRYGAPTLIVFGVSYKGLAEIQSAVNFDPNL